MKLAQNDTPRHLAALAKGGRNGNPLEVYRRPFAEPYPRSLAGRLLWIALQAALTGLFMLAVCMVAEVVCTGLTPR